MKMITSFDPTAATSGTFDPKIANPCGTIMLFNESPVGIQLTFSDGSIANLPPYYTRPYKVQKTGYVNWQQLYTVQSGASPLSIVVGEAYESAEAAKTTFSQGPLNRQVTVPNTVTTSQGSTLSIVNDGSASTVQLVEATPSGDPGSAVVLTAGGALTLGNATHKGSITMLGPLSTDSALLISDGNGNLTAVSLKLSGGSSGGFLPQIVNDASGNIVFKVGNTTILTINSGGFLNARAGTIDTNFFVLGTLSTDSGSISTDGAGNLTVNGTIGCGGGYTQNGGDMAIGSHNISSVNNITCNGTLTLNTGTISRLKIFNGTGNSSVNTGLGTTPTTICWNPCTQSGSSQTIGGTNAQTSVVTTGSGLAWNGTAIKT